jgi:adenylate cyclase
MNLGLASSRVEWCSEVFAMAEPAQHIRVLVVDDHYDSEEALARLLRLCGYTVFEAFSGATAFSIAVNLLPDIIITDVNMPGVSGIELTEMIRSDPVARTIPIVTITAQGRSVLRAARNAGADLAMEKPLDFEGLLNDIEVLTRPSHTSVQNQNPRPV